MKIGMTVAAIAAGIVTCDGAVPADMGTFRGFRALVVEPENSWTWDSAVFGALEERAFEVSFGRIPDEPAALRRYDLVALSIKRTLSTTETENLERYVRDGGAIYGSWGGPMGSPAFLRDVCQVGRTKSLRLMQLVLLDSPLSQGVFEDKLALAERAGHTQAGSRGWEIVMVQPLDEGIPVAKDGAGNVLGVLSRYGNGRTAILGFGPEKEKYFVRSELGPLMLDNLLAWLLEAKLTRGPQRGAGRVKVALPARAEVLEVFVNGRRISDPSIMQVGSLKKVELDLSGVAPGEDAEIRVDHTPLSKGRNVEAVIHLPWNTLRAAADSPAHLAEYLKSLGATVCQPLLRSSFGHAWYKGMPQDEHDEVLVKQYEGDFLADLIKECHLRGIKVIGGIYFDHATPVRKYPDVKRLDKQGSVIRDRYGRVQACFNNPKGQDHNFNTIKHLLDGYNLDGIILDDNFELDKTPCYCAYCEAAFKEYCQTKGVAFRGFSQASEPTFGDHWRQHRREATRRLAAGVRQIARAHGVPAGGWVAVGMDSIHLAEAFDFLGGMVYATPPRSVRGPLSVLGECKLVCLLWAPNTDPNTMEREVHEAVHAGCSAVGFWIRADDGGYEMDARRSEAMRRALGTVEQQWLDFYRQNVLTGDNRFVIVRQEIGVGQLTVKVRNKG